VKSKRVSKPSSTDTGTVRQTLPVSPEPLLLTRSWLVTTAAEPLRLRPLTLANEG
jgi:hypothetical protein